LQSYKGKSEHRDLPICEFLPEQLKGKDAPGSGLDSLRKMAAGADEKAPDAKAVDVFAASWKEKSKELEKSPLGPVIAELGKQLADGKLDPEALQKALKDVKFNADDQAKYDKMLKQFTNDLKERYGLDVQIDWRGKGSEVYAASLSISEANGAHQFNTSIRIDLTGKAIARDEFREGTAGPIVKDMSTGDAMKKLREHMNVKR